MMSTNRSDGTYDWKVVESNFFGRVEFCSSIDSSDSNKDSKSITSINSDCILLYFVPGPSQNI